MQRQYRAEGRGFKKQIMKQKKESFYKQFFSIYILLVLQNVITLSVNLTDNVMLGSYRETALAGAAAVNQIQFIFQQCLVGLGDGVVIICSQYWGRKEVKNMKKFSAIAMCSAICLAFLLFVFTSTAPDHAVGFFTSDHMIIKAGMDYLSIIRFTYVLFAIIQILLATLRSVEVVKIAFRLSVLAFFLNCGINYLLIFGKFGFPELGIKGAAVGTLCSRIVEFIVLLMFIWKKETKLKLRLADYKCLDKSFCKDYFRITGPLLITQGLWGLNTALQTFVLGHMNSAAIAANSVSSTLFLLIKSASVGAAASATVIIGTIIGTGEIELVKRYAKKMQKIFLCIGLCSGLALFCLKGPFLSLYNLQPETMKMTNTFLNILCIVVVGMSYQMPTNSGIIRGGGSVNFVVKMDLISIWAIVIPLSFFMAFVVKVSPVVVFVCLNLDQLFKCVPAFLKVNYGNWIKKLTKD